MRRFLIAVLLSGAAASPALAQDWNDHGHHHDRQNNNNNNDNGRAQHQRGQSEAPRNNGGNYYRQQAPQFVRQQPVQVQQDRRSGWGGQRFEVQQGQRGGWNGQRFEGRNVAVEGQVQEQQGYGGYRGGYNGQVQQQQYRQGTRYAGSNWNRDWRRDRRYDWRDYRNEHRSIFRLGTYYDPFGYGYRSFDIGFQLAPVYFGQRYWIDPAMYELPYPPPGTQWIRYWNDAVLVDMYSGEVVDVIHDFFW